MQDDTVVVSERLKAQVDDVLNRLNNGSINATGEQFMAHIGRVAKAPFVEGDTCLRSIHEHRLYIFRKVNGIWKLEKELEPNVTYI